jgi:hypothetical protein
MSDDSRQKHGGMYAGEIDPEVADLIGITSDTGTLEEIPDFADLFDEKSDDDDITAFDIAPDLTVRTFTIPTKFEEETKPFFSDKDYYKNVLTGEGDISQRVHTILGSFLNAQEPADRSNYRSRLIPAYWELLSRTAPKVIGAGPTPKTLAMRFAVLLPTLLSIEQRSMLSRTIFDNTTDEPIHYVDEWITLIARGKVNPSAVDETKLSQQNSNQKLNALLEKTRGRFEAQISLIRNKQTEIQDQESLLAQHLQQLSNHHPQEQYNGLWGPYSDAQKSSLSEMGNVIRKLMSVNKDMAREFTELSNIQDQLDDLRRKESETGGSAIDGKVVVAEVNTVRQMAKMCIGRQGNHFPVLMKQYFRGGLHEVGTRENVIKAMAHVEHLDSGIFLRTFKMQTNRIVPNVIIIPCYGETGICWEPFERFNRASSRGRLAIPMYPKDITVAVVAALGDLRWQVAKEKAQHYWMEEGLTGWYYQWFSDTRQKGDVKDAFIQDYILWITKESEGTQKLVREVRDIFWRYLPFPQEIKDKLKNRGFVYSELYKKDQNRAMSDGY